MVRDIDEGASREIQGPPGSQPIPPHSPELEPNPPAAQLNVPAWASDSNLGGVVHSVSPEPAGRIVEVHFAAPPVAMGGPMIGAAPRSPALFGGAPVAPEPSPAREAAGRMLLKSDAEALAAASSKEPAAREKKEHEVPSDKETEDRKSMLERSESMEVQVDDEPPPQIDNRWRQELGIQPDSPRDPNR